jgi:phosphatidylglycerol:prolipoprotein diacylglycerol transferase
MHKLLIEEPHIGSYSFCLVVALFAGYLITRWRAPRVGIKASHIDNLILLVALFSLFGARFFSWLFYFPPGVSLWEALRDTGGGMVFYGGFVFGLATVVVYALGSRIELGNLLDAFSPGLALGLAIGRIGCFMAGCCWGDVCAAPNQLAALPRDVPRWQIQTLPGISGARFPLAVRFPPESGAYEQHRKLGLVSGDAARSLPVHPVQLYESALALALCFYLHRRFSDRNWNGQISCNLLFGYAAIRFCTEFLRADNPPIYLGLTLSQVISIAIAASASTAVAWHRIGRRQVRAVPTPRVAPVHASRL